MNQTTLTLKSYVRGIYDMQKLRIMEGNRIVANYRKKMGIPPSTKDKADPFSEKVMKDLRDAYKRITDGIVGLPKPGKFVADGLISDYAELCLIDGYINLLDQETRMFGMLTKLLPQFPIWTEYLENVKGCGPAMSSIIISMMDPEKAVYPSSFWKYAGLDVAQDGAGRSKRKEHLVKCNYIDREGKVAERDGITFNPLLRDKLLGVLAGSFLIHNKEYAQIYNDYKARLDNHPKHADKVKNHKHRMALRYMIKRFLVDLHLNWRRLARLPVYEEYSVAKLGMVHRKVA